MKQLAPPSTRYLGRFHPEQERVVRLHHGGERAGKHAEVLPPPYVPHLPQIMARDRGRPFSENTPAGKHTAGRPRTNAAPASTAGGQHAPGPGQTKHGALEHSRSAAAAHQLPGHAGSPSWRGSCARRRHVPGAARRARARSPRRARTSARGRPGQRGAVPHVCQGVSGCVRVCQAQQFPWPRALGFWLRRRHHTQRGPRRRWRHRQLHRQRTKILRLAVAPLRFNNCGRGGGPC